MLKPLNIGLIGFGRMGKVLADNFHQPPHTQIAAISDICPLAQGSLGGKPYKNAEFFIDYQVLLARTDVDAVVISTLPEQHFAMAKAALEFGKHVFVEKPMTTSAEEARELMALAEKRGLQLGVDHVLTYEEAALHIANHLERKTYGEVAEFTHRRIHTLAPHLQQRSCFIELAPHPLSLLDMFDQHQSDSARIIVTGDMRRNFNAEIILSSGLKASIIVAQEAGLPREQEQRGTTLTFKPKRISQDASVAHKLDWNEMRLPERQTQTIAVQRDGSLLRSDECGRILPLESAAQDFAAAIRDSRSPKANGEHAVRVAELMEGMERAVASGVAVSVNLMQISHIGRYTGRI